VRVCDRSIERRSFLDDDGSSGPLRVVADVVVTVCCRPARCSSANLAPRCAAAVSFRRQFVVVVVDREVGDVRGAVSVDGRDDVPHGYGVCSRCLPLTANQHVDVTVTRLATTQSHPHSRRRPQAGLQTRQQRSDVVHVPWTHHPDTITGR